MDICFGGLSAAFLLVQHEYVCIYVILAEIKTMTKKLRKPAAEMLAKLPFTRNRKLEYLANFLFLIKKLFLYCTLYIFQSFAYGCFEYSFSYLYICSLVTFI